VRYQSFLGATTSVKVHFSPMRFKSTFSFPTPPTIQNWWSRIPLAVWCHSTHYNCAPFLNMSPLFIPSVNKPLNDLTGFFTNTSRILTRLLV
jgi:hypothetical protein